MTNNECALGIGHWDFLRASSFVIRIFLPSVVLCLFSGCASRPQTKAHVPDWEMPGLAGHPSRLQPEKAPTVTNASEITSVPTHAAAGATTAPPAQFTETWIALERWCKAAGQCLPSRETVSYPVTYSLNTTNGVFVLQAGSKSARWNGAELRMGFAPQLINGQLFVHRLDLQKTLQPLMVAPATFARADSACSHDSEVRPTIVIDPGHGGPDSGAKSILGNKYEKEFTLDWARRLVSLLETNGWQVFLTRTYDGDISLSNRVLFAQQHKADLFLSLHFNSAGTNETQCGLETYCLTPTGMASTVTRGFPDQQSLSFPNNEFDGENLCLASLVHKQLLEVNGHRDRSVRRARFLGVLRGQQRPAILIEGGYLSNRQEATMIARPEYRQKLAQAVATALQAAIKPSVSAPMRVSLD